MAKHSSKDPKVRIGKKVRRKKFNKLLIFNTILIVGLYGLHFKSEIQDILNHLINIDILTKYIN